MCVHFDPSIYLPRYLGTLGIYHDLAPYRTSLQPVDKSDDQLQCSCTLSLTDQYFIRHTKKLRYQYLTATSTFKQSSHFL